MKNTKSVRRLRAYLLGVRDGWRQPYELSVSYNVDHLAGTPEENAKATSVYETLDRGINLGQFLRGGRKSQSYLEYGFGRLRKKG